MSGAEKIASIVLDQGSIKYRTPEIEHERNTAVADLLHENVFAPIGMQGGPYDVHLGVKENRLHLDIRSQAGQSFKMIMAVQPFKRIIRDYFLVCETYYEALKLSKAKVEAIDMGRRSIHNEGAEMLQYLLEGRVTVDFPTARRLFTLICVLHIK